MDSRVYSQSSFSTRGDNFLDPILFEDLPLGGTWTTRRRTITAADLAAFAGVAAEFSPLVVDETYARGTSFGGHVVPGTMISSLAVGLGSLDVPIPASAGMVGMTWRFLLPVRPGDSLETTWRLNRKRAVQNPAVGLCFWSIDVLNHRGEIVATGEVGRLVRRRQHQGRATEAGPAAPAASAPEPQAATAPEAPAAEPADGSEPARRRRRRGGRGGGASAPTAPESPAAAEARALPSLPDPAPADAPSPGRRRRRRGGRGGGGGGASGAPSPSELAPPPPPVELGSPAPARTPAPEGGLRGVFRRLRGS